MVVVVVVCLFAYTPTVTSDLLQNPAADMLLHYHATDQIRTLEVS